MEASADQNRAAEDLRTHLGWYRPGGSTAILAVNVSDGSTAVVLGTSGRWQLQPDCRARKPKSRTMRLLAEASRWRKLDRNTCGAEQGFRGCERCPVEPADGRHRRAAWREDRRTGRPTKSPSPPLKGTGQICQGRV